MRILLVTTWFPTTLAPSSGIFVAKDVELLAREHEVHVVHLAAPRLLAGDEPETVAGARVTRVPMPTADPLAIRRAWRVLRPLLDASDVLHTQAFSALLPFAGRRVAVPWVHTEHWSGLPQPESVHGPWRLARPLLLPLLRKPDVVTAVCRYLGDAVARVRRGPIRIVPCVVEPVAVAPRPGGTAPRLVAVGGLVDRKDPLCAVAAVAELHRRGIPAALDWVGDGPLRDQVEAAVRAAGLEHAVRLLGVRDVAGVGSALDDADLFLLPTKGENFCVSAAEAIVHGRAVVVGALGGQGEYLTPETGELVHEQSPRAYADAVERMLAATAATTPAQVAATIGDRFSSDSVARGYAQAYELAAARPA